MSKNSINSKTSLTNVRLTSPFTILTKERVSDQLQTIAVAPSISYHIIFDARISSLDHIQWNKYNVVKISFDSNSQMQLICDASFADLTTLVSVSIPSSLETLIRNVFKDCINLEEVVFSPNSSLTRIQEKCFYGCYSLKNITLPSSLIRLNESVFYKNSQLENVVFPTNSKLSRIGKSCFSYCDKLGSINFPASLHSIRPYAFYECSNLKNVIFPTNSKLDEICDYAFSHTAIKSIEFPSSLIEIGTHAFQFCVDLHKIVFHSSSQIAELKEKTFANCSLSNVIFPNSLKNVSSYVFQDCSSLTTLILSSTTPDLQIHSKAFDGCDSLLFILTSKALQFAQNRQLDRLFPNTIFFEVRNCNQGRLNVPHNIVYIGTSSTGYNLDLYTDSPLYIHYHALKSMPLFTTSLVDGDFSSNSRNLELMSNALISITIDGSLNGFPKY